MPWNPDSMWPIHGCVECVDPEHHTISLWVDKDQFATLQKVALTESIPQWMRFSGVPFSTYIPRSCLDAGNLEGVVWEPFLCNGMEYWTEAEAFWQMGQIGSRVADRSCHEDLADGPARACARDLWLLLSKLFSLHQSNGWPTLPSPASFTLDRTVQEMRLALVQAFQVLYCEHPGLHALCEKALKPHAPENEDDFSGCSDLQRLHASISQLLDCEAESVILARLLMEIYPDQASRLQTMVEQYHQQAPSPLTDEGEAEAEQD